MCLCFAVHFYSAVVIIVIIYHYSGRERKIVSSGDMGAVCRACCNSWDGEMLACKMWVWSAWISMHTLKLEPEMQSIHHIHNVACSVIKSKLQIVVNCCSNSVRIKLTQLSSNMTVILCRMVRCLCVWVKEREVTSGGWPRATRHPLVHPLSLLLTWPSTSGWEGGVSQELGEFIISCFFSPPLIMPFEATSISTCKHFSTVSEIISVHTKTPGNAYCMTIHCQCK